MVIDISAETNLPMDVCSNLEGMTTNSEQLLGGKQKTFPW